MSEFLNQHETKNAPKTTSFFEMTDSDISELRTNLEKHSGLLRVFIHPDFENYKEFEQELFDETKKSTHEDHAKRLKLLEDAFTKIISDPNSPPVFIFLEPYHLEKLTNLIEGVTKNKAYIVPTVAGDSTPKIVNRPDIDYDESDWEWRSWFEIKKLFEKVGVKKILIGGAELYEIGEKNISGCLGQAVKRLEPYFNLELSALTYPAKKIEIRSLAS
jgi:hypothetical protein